jgi:hypothetical protein
MHPHDLFSRPTTIAHNSYALQNDSNWHQIVGTNIKRVAVIITHSNATPINVCLGDPGSTAGRPGFWVSGYNSIMLTRAELGAAIEQPLYVYDTEAGSWVNVDEIIAP